MGKTKYSDSSLAKAEGILDIIQENEQSTKKTFERFRQEIEANYDTWKEAHVGAGKSDVDGEGEQAKTVYMDFKQCGKKYDSIEGANNCQRTHNAANIEAIRGALTAGEGKLAEAVDSVATYRGKLATFFGALKEAISVFEGTSINLEAAIDAVGNPDVNNGEFVFDAQSLEDGTEVVVVKYKDADGNEYTIAEMVNAAYTYIGSAMSAAVAVGVANDGMDAASLDNLLNGSVTNVGSKVNDYLNNGLFGIASLSNIQGFYEDVTDKKFSNVADAFSKIDIDVSDSNVDVDKIAESFGKGTNAQLYNVAAVAAGVMGAYNLTDYLISDDEPGTETEIGTTSNNTEDPVLTPSNTITDTGGGPSYSGGGGGVTPTGGTGNGNGDKNKTDTTVGTQDKDTEEDKDKEKDKDKTTTDEEKDKDKTTDEEKDKDKTTDEEKDKEKDQDDNEENNDPTNAVEAPKVEVTKMEERGELPEEIKLELGEKDYDELAREQFEAQGDAAIAERRAKIVQEANELFDAEDKSQLIAKLKEYGYTEFDINDIIKDRNLVTSALIEGDQRQQMAAIANDLAKADGVTDFNTIYDDGQTCQGLIDGSNEALLSNLSADPTVATAKTALTDATKTYTESVTAAQEAITKVNETQKAVETTKAEIVESMAKDTNNWSDAQQKIYSKEVKAAQDSFIKENGDPTKWDSTKTNAYQKISTDIKDKYVKEVQEDPSKWSNEQIEKYNSSVEEYNNALKDANTKYQASQDAKKAYDTSKASYDKLKETYLQNVRNANKKLDYHVDYNSVSSDVTNGVQDPVGGSTSGSQGSVGGSGITDDQLLNGVVHTDGNSASIG